MAAQEHVILAVLSLVGIQLVKIPVRLIVMAAVPPHVKGTVPGVAKTLLTVVTGVV